MSNLLGIHNSLTATTDKDMKEYYNMFDNNLTKATAVGEEKRKEEYLPMVVSFYNLVTDFYEYGWGESFHFAPRYEGETFKQAIARHEHYIPLRLQMKPGMKVMDCGCGVGGPAREIARFSGAYVTGLNINDYQISKAKKHTERDGLEGLVNFVKGDFLKMPFEEGQFDAAYELEATVHSPDLDAIYSELFRVLKPGGHFAGYAWAMTEKYDPKNEEHKEIKYRIEIGNGLPPMHTKPEIINAMKKAGFRIIEATDFSRLTNQFPIPWYDTLNATYSITGFRYTRVGRVMTSNMLSGLEKVGLAVKGSVDAANMLNDAAVWLVAGGKEEIFTPSYFIYAEKPAV